MDALTAGLNIDRAQHAELLARLDVLLATPSFQERVREHPVEAVGVYRSGEGGLFVKRGGGDGHIRFAGDERIHTLRLRMLSAGAEVGGSASWGIVLALGLHSPAEIEGRYVATLKSATAGDEQTGTTRATHRLRKNTIYFVSVSQGLSANAGREELRLVLDD